MEKIYFGRCIICGALLESPGDLCEDCKDEDGLCYEDLGWCEHGCAPDEDCEECI